MKQKQKNNKQKEKWFSWFWLIFWIIVFWPVAIIYLYIKSKQREFELSDKLKKKDIKIK